MNNTVAPHTGWKMGPSTLPSLLSPLSSSFSRTHLPPALFGKLSAPRPSTTAPAASPAVSISSKPYEASRPGSPLLQPAEPVTSNHPAATLHTRTQPLLPCDPSRTQATLTGGGSRYKTLTTPLSTPARNALIKTSNTPSPARPRPADR